MVKRGRHLGRIEREILNDLTLGDIMYGFLLSAHSTRRFHKLARQHAKDRYRRKLAMERLRKNGYIEFVKNLVSITEAGKNALGIAIERNRQSLNTRSWDHKWYIATFDIPEKYAPLRNKVRAILKRAGFLQLQQSVWIFPHPCKELVALIKNDSRLSRHILYGVLDSIEDETRLKRLFGLH